MAFAAQLIVDPSERRGDDRRPVEVPGTLRGEGQAPLDVVVHDLSATGFLVESGVPLAIRSVVRLGVAGIGASEARVVRAEGDRYGCRFLRPISPQQVRMAGAVDTVHRDAFRAEAAAAQAEPVVAKLPVRARLTVVIGSATLLWALIIAGARAALR